MGVGQLLKRLSNLTNLFRGISGNWFLLLGPGTRSFETFLGRGQVLARRLRCVYWFNRALMVVGHVLVMVTGDMKEEV